MNTIVGTDCSVESMFNVMGGWTSQFEINGKIAGGYLRLDQDERLTWHMNILGGVKGKRILELGPLEGAHTKMMIEAGAREVIAVEGLPDCFLRCLIVKEAFQLNRAKFIFGDFCNYIADYSGEKFDLVSAAGVLYHQINPAKLIYDLARITDNVIVWSQVADWNQKGDMHSVTHNGKSYFGRIVQWGDARTKSESYCASLSSQAFWMFPKHMIGCFIDAGFTKIIEKPSKRTINGECLLFVASKK
jgi:hypothetical protein